MHIFLHSLTNAINCHLIEKKIPDELNKSEVIPLQKLDPLKKKAFRHIYQKFLRKSYKQIRISCAENLFSD